MNDATQSQTPGMSLAELCAASCTSLVRWRDKIEKALEHAGGQYNFDDVTVMVIHSKLHVYDYGDCLIIMKVDEFPRYRAYHCFIACGDMQSIMSHQEDMRLVAKQLDCTELTINGRPGWPRVLKDKGWKQRFATIYTEV